MLIRTVLFAFLTSLFLVFSNTASAQYTISAPADLTMCGTNKSVSIIYTGATVIDHTFKLDFDISGLYFYNPTTLVSGVSFQLSSGKKELIVHADNLSSGQAISFEIWASCGVSIGNETSKLGTLQLKNSIGTVVQAASIVVYQNQNASLSSAPSNPTWDQFGSLGSIIVRDFVLKNNDTKAFNGVINFHDTPKSLSSAINIKNIKYVIKDASGNIQGSIETLLNNVTAPIAQVIQPNWTITISETIELTKCITTDIYNINEGESDAYIQTGCRQEEMCYGINSGYSLKVKEDPGQAIITKQQLIRDEIIGGNYFQCFDEQTMHNASFSYKNTGTANANNLKLLFKTAVGYLTDKTSLQIDILDANGNLKSTGAILWNNETRSDNIGGAQNESWDNFFTVTYTGAKATAFAGCSPQEGVLVSARITDYMTATGPSPIHLQPQETVRLRWKDRHCCFPENLKVEYEYFDNLIAYLGDCSGNITPVNPSFFSLVYNSFIQDPLPYAPTLNGNPDKCMTTNDGQITTMSLQNKAMNYGFLPREINNWGDLVMDLSIENGLDLDLSNNGTALPPSYNESPTCNFNNCATCVIGIAPMSETYSIFFIDDKTGNKLYPKTTVDDKIRLISSDANFKNYRIVFSYADLIPLIDEAIRQAGNPDRIAEYVQALLSSMRLEMKLRASCPANIKSHVTERLAYRSNRNLCNSEACLMPLFSKVWEYTVVCPGCPVPGGNVTSSQLERTPDFLGLEDNDDNGVPDNNTKISSPLLKASCTNGDELVGSATVLLSNGDRSLGGFTLADIESRSVNGNLDLDNLYLKVGFDNEYLQYIEASSVTVLAEASLNGSTGWVPADFYTIIPATEQSPGGFMIHVQASDFGLSNFHNRINGIHVAQNIYIRYYLKIKRSNTIAYDLGPAKLVYLSNTPYFSDCDDCLNPVTHDFGSFPGGDAKEKVWNWSDLNGPPNMQNSYYFCASDQGLINYIPSTTAVAIDKLTADNSCNPKMIYNWLVRTVSTNPFSKEYRPLINNGGEVSLKLNIPEGFRVKYLSIDNRLYGGLTITAGLPYNDFYLLRTNEEVMTAAANHLLTINPNGELVLPLHNRWITSSETPISHYNETYQGDALRIGDDYYNMEVIVIFEPVNCSAPLFESVYTIDEYVSNVHSPYTVLPSSKITLPKLTNTLAGIREIVGGNGYIPIHEPDTRLTASSGNNVYPVDEYYYVPIYISNLDPLDLQLNPLKNIKNQLITSVNAMNPFLHLKANNLADLLAKGFTVEGVYAGKITTQSALSGKTNFYNQQTHIAALKSNLEQDNFILARSANNEYTIVLKYECTTCNPVLSKCATAETEDDYPACLLASKQLQVDYGWNCDKYPTTESEVTEACLLKSINDPIQLKTPAVALTLEPSVNGIIGFCSNFIYTAKIKSCKEGSINDLKLIIILPPGIEFVSVANGLNGVVSNNILTINNINNGIPLTNNNSELTIAVTLKLTSYLSSTSDIKSTASGLSYCGTPVSTEKIITVNFTPPVTVANSSYCVNDPAVEINAVIPGGVFTASPSVGLIDNGNGTATFSPSQAGVGVTRVTYTLTLPATCTAVQDITVNSCCFATAAAGIDQAGCWGTTFTLNAVNPQAGYTYTWTGNGHTFTGAIVNLTAGAPGYPSAGSTINYTLTVTATNNVSCLATDVISIQVYSIPTVDITTADGKGSVLIPICHSSVILKATIDPNYYYQWNYNGAIIPGATNSTHTVNLGYAGIYRVDVTDRNTLCTNSATKNVIGAISISGDDEICPGEKAYLSLQLDGVGGDYQVQWFQDDNVNFTTTPSGTYGNYYALVVLHNPECTLTAPTKPVLLKPVPAAFTITGGNINFCPEDYPNGVVITGTAPSSSPTGTDDKWSWTTGSHASSITVFTAGSYGINVIAKNGCSNSSGTVLVAPFISITQKCNVNGTTTLKASSNVLGVSNYTWTSSVLTQPMTGATIDVTQDGTYYVSTTDLRCNTTAQITVCRNVTAANVSLREDFDKTNITEPCSNAMMDGRTEFTCINQGVALYIGEGLNKWIGKTRVTSNAASEISEETPGDGSSTLWLGGAYPNTRISTDQYFLVTDGAITSSDMKLWHTTVNVETCATYSFRAMVMNLLQEAKQELPQVYLKIEDHTLNQTIVFNGKDWKQLGGTWKSDVTGTVEISIMLKAGGFVGRDIGLDEIYFHKIDCSQPNSELCNAVAEVGAAKYICAGGSIEIGNNTTTPGLTYAWTATNYSSSTMNPSVSPTVTTEYTLKVTDLANQCSATDKVTVNIIEPSVSIQLTTPSTCGTDFSASLFNGMGSAQYAWFVNNVQKEMNLTGLFSPVGLNVGDKVKCKLISGCTSQPFSNEIIVITTNNPVISNLTASPNHICKNENSVLSATVSDGLAPYTYEWKTGVTVVGSTATVTVSPMSMTNYTLIVTGQNGCKSAPATVNLSASGTDALGAVYSNSTLCQGATFNLQYFVSVCAAFNPGNILTVQLSDASRNFNVPTIIGTLPTTDASGGVISVTIPAGIATGGTYRIRVISSDKAYIGADNGVDITMLASPTIASATASPAEICAGETVNFSSVITGGVSPYTYAWKNGSGGTLSTAALFNTTLNSSLNGALIVTSANGCSVIKSPIVVKLNPKPSISMVVSSPGLICAGESSSITMTATNGTPPYTYEWKQGATTIGTSASVTVSPSTTTTYTPVVTDSKGCKSPTGGITATITNNNDSPITTSVSTTSYCAGSSMSVTFNTSNCAQIISPNTYTVQLSDASGNFDNLLNIGSLNTIATSGTIICTVPETMQPGSKYKVRVVSSNLPHTGTSNSSNLTITTGCNALSFDGVDDRVIIPNQSAYNLGGDFVMEAWIKASSFSHTQSTIMSNRTVGSSNTFAFLVGNNGTQLLFKFNGNTHTSSTAFNVNDNACHHVAVKRSGTGNQNLTFFVDGVAKGTSTATFVISTTNALLIGYDSQDGSSTAFTGFINDVRIWNAATSIAANMNVVVPGNTTGLKGYWPLNESGTGQIVYDASLTQNNGTRGTNSGAADAQDPSRQLAASCMIPTLRTGLLFDGIDDRITLPNASYLSHDFTVEAWVQMPSQTSGVIRPAILSGRTSDNNGFLFTTGYSGTKLIVRINNVDYTHPTAFTDIHDNTCHHVAVTRSASTLTFYVDGVSKGFIGAVNTDLSSMTANWKIGDDGYASVNNSLKGNINELRIWDRAFTATDLNNRAVVLPTSTQNLTGYWKAMETSGEVVYDASINNNHGYLGTNATQFDAQNPLRNSNSCYSGDRHIQHDDNEDNLSNSKSEVNIYPNPFQHNTTILVDGPSGERSMVRFTDLNGRTVQELSVLNKEETLVAGSLPGGVYIIEVISEQGKSIHKIIKVE